MEQIRQTSYYSVICNVMQSFLHILGSDRRIAEPSAVRLQKLSKMSSSSVSPNSCWAGLWEGQRALGGENYEKLSFQSNYQQDLLYDSPPLLYVHVPFGGVCCTSPQEGCKMMVGSIFVFGMFAALCFIMSKWAIDDNFPC